MKKITKRTAPFILIGLTVAFSACSEQEDFTDEGREAAIEFCECYKKNTKEKCLDDLKNKYGAHQYMSEEFINSFNETSSCGVELIIEQEKSAAYRMESKRDNLLLIIEE